MTYLRAKVPDDCVELLSYFDSTYVTGTSRAIRCNPATLRMRFRRQPPMFPPETWNVYDATIANAPRTNNETEAWNNAFSRQIGHSHPSLYRLLDNLRKDAALVKVALEAEARGKPPRKRVRRATHELQDRLRSLCVARKEGRKSTTQHIIVFSAIFSLLFHY